MKGDAGCQTPLWAHGEPGALDDQVVTPPGVTATLSQGSARSAVHSPTGVLPRPIRGMSEGVRPVFPGSGGQNRRTAPPLASGHLKERSAPGGTGNPRSIFTRGSRNPEDRVGRPDRGKDGQNTERGKEAR